MFDKIKLTQAYQFALTAARLSNPEKDYSGTPVAGMDPSYLDAQVKEKFGSVTPKRRIRMFIETSEATAKDAGVKLIKLPGHLGAHDAIAIRAAALEAYLLPLLTGIVVADAPSPVEEKVGNTAAAIAEEIEANEKLGEVACNTTHKPAEIAAAWIEELSAAQDGSPELKKALNAAKMMC